MIFKMNSYPLLYFVSSTLNLAGIPVPVCESYLWMRSYGIPYNQGCGMFVYDRRFFDLKKKKKKILPSYEKKDCDISELNHL